MKKIFSILSLTTLGLLSAATAKAIPCAICTIAVGSFVGLAQWLKVDDRITGLWVGALLASLVAWTIHYLDKKNIRFRGRKILAVILWYGFVIIPFYFTGMIGHPLNKVWGIDKLLLGITLGTAIFVVANLFHDYLKRKNQSKVYFHYQKAVLPVSFLAAVSVVLYFLSKYK